MERGYILSIDQSTQGTKAILLDGQGQFVLRRDLPHRQLISAQGWVGHDAKEIAENIIRVAQAAVRDSGIDSRRLAGVAVTNQRESVALWERDTGRPVCESIVWQCNRAAELCRHIQERGDYPEIQRSPPPFSLPGRWPGRWNMCLGPERRLNGDSSASAPWILGRSGSSPEEKSTERIAATPPAPSCLISIPWSGIRSCAGYLISPCQCCPRCAALMGNMDRQIWEDCWTIRCRSEVLSGTPMPPFLDTDAWSGGTAWRVMEQAPAY